MRASPWSFHRIFVKPSGGVTACYERERFQNDFQSTINYVYIRQSGGMYVCMYGPPGVLQR